MGKLVVTEFISLDGIIEDPGGAEGTEQGGWSFREFGKKMNAMPKVVVSTTLTEATWNNTTIISGDLAAEVGRMKAQYQGDILVAGSATLVHALTRLGLVDEYRLMVHPVVLGWGKRLFQDARPSTTLKLASSQPVGPDGVIVLTYVPVRD